MIECYKESNAALAVSAGVAKDLLGYGDGGTGGSVDHHGADKITVAITNNDSGSAAIDSFALYFWLGTIQVAAAVSLGSLAKGASMIFTTDTFCDRVSVTATSAAGVSALHVEARGYRTSR